MDFTYGNFPLFVKIEAMQPHLRAELGQYVLDFDVRFSPNNPFHPQYPRNGILIADDFKICVLLRDAQKIIGVAEPGIVGGGSTIIPIKPQIHQFDVSLRFHLFLTSAMLEAVEEVRNGGDLHLTLKISANVTGYDSNENEREDASGITWVGENLWNAAPARVYVPRQCLRDGQLTVPQSGWIELLARAGFSKVILCEIPIPESADLGPAAGYVREAQIALGQGRYADVVARCRDALDAITERSSFSWRDLASKEWREGMAIEDRLKLSWNSLRHITHATHHRNGMKGEFTRPMAQYVLGTTLLTLSLAARDNDLFTRASHDQEK